VQVALVLDDVLALDAGGVLLELHRLALDDVLESDATRAVGQDRDAVRVPGGQHVAGLDLGAVGQRQHRAQWHGVAVELAALVVHDDEEAVAVQRDLLALLVLALLDAVVAQLALAGGLDLALGQRAAGRAADVEGAHRELRARLADGLGRDDADGQAHLRAAAAREVHAVAGAADAVAGLAGQRAAHAHLLVAERLDAPRDLEGDELVLLDDDLVRDHVHDRVPRHAAADLLRQRDVDLVALHHGALGHAVDRAAVQLADHDVLGHVRELAGQVARVRGLERGVRQALARAVRGAEVLQHAQALAEIALDGRLDDLARGLGHQA